jgi:hypothetical protein
MIVLPLLLILMTRLVSVVISRTVEISRVVQVAIQFFKVDASTPPAKGLAKF